MKKLGSVFNSLKDFINDELRDPNTSNWRHSHDGTVDHPKASSESKEQRSKDDHDASSKKDKAVTKDKLRERMRKKEEKKIKKKMEKEIIKNTVQQAVKYTQWSSAIEKKSKTITGFIKDYFKTSEEPASADPKALKKQISTVIQEVIALLEVDGFTYDDYSSHSKAFRIVRENLLSLWQILLDVIEKTDEEVLNYYKTILLIMKRKEFDNSHLHLDVHDQPTCPEHDQEIAFHYRTLLYSTQMFVTNRLSKPLPFNKAHNLNLFCARVLAVTVFRIPLIGEQVISAFNLEPKSLKDMMGQYQKETGNLWPFDWGNERLSIEANEAKANEKLTQSSNETHPKEENANKNSATAQPEVSEKIPPISSEKQDAATLQNTSVISEPAKSEAIELSDKPKPTAISTIPDITNHVIENYMDSEDKKVEKESKKEITGGHIILPPIPRHRKTLTSSSQSIKLMSSFPVLFKWTLYHAALKEQFEDNLDEKLFELGNTWLQTLAKRETLFLVFLREWISHIKSCIGDTRINWNHVRGYEPLLHSFLYDFKMIDQFPKALIDATLALLDSDRNLINIFIRILFQKTNVYQVPQVLECLNITEQWFKEIKNTHKTLPFSFDVSFFCKGLAVILDTDHHQLLGKLLALLYNYSEIFEGDVRISVYCNLLIQKYFFPLFLHWDDNVRNSFQQILVFKLIRMKRSLLHAEGALNIEELATRDLGKTKPALEDKRRHSSPVEDRERFVDAVLYAKVEASVRIIQDQVRDGKINHYDKTLEVYVPKALSEYKMYLSRYYSWERSGEVEPPKLVPMHMLSEAEIDI